ncbi:MAG: Flp pilus assembly complex ATPase component TadA [Gammaproteobacteria bacterium]|nr:Flp pilus assembly complex ATPase component TadA [Gammaproteobacteria bacterium]
MAENRRKPIGVLLKEKGIIHDGHINLALQDQNITGDRLGETLERLALVSPYDIATTIAEQAQREVVDVGQVVPEEASLRLFNMNLCRTNTFLPMRHDRQCIEVVTAADDTVELERLINRKTGLQSRIYQGEKPKILNAVQHFFYFLEHPVEELLAREVKQLEGDVDGVRSLDPLLNHLFQLAVKLRSTDIHIRPLDRAINIALRIDGVLRPVISLPLSLRRIISTIKMKASMDIAEQRLPLDGSYSGTILENPYDFRVSTTVTQYGENMVIRLLPMRSDLMGLSQLGFAAEDIETIHQIFSSPYGIALLTGPTGSGKSTTLYAAVRALNLTELNVMTVENPIEYRLPLARQTEVNIRAGYTFANAIRFFLRHDPDVILVGEIRDEETAKTALSASETGHMVLSTLHTNTAFGAIPRLRALGAEPYMLGESIVGIVSQRLARRLCHQCRQAYTATAEDLHYLKLETPAVEVGDSVGEKGEVVATDAASSPPLTLYRAKGCDTCAHTGYFGRMLVYEIVKQDREIATMLHNDASMEEMVASAKSRGFKDIFECAREKVLAGSTSVEEMTRVIGY